MIRLHKVRPYKAVQESTFMLSLYDYNQSFQLQVKQPPAPVNQLDIIYDGGTVGDVVDNVIITSEEQLSDSPRTTYIIYDGGGVSLNTDEMEAVIDGNSNN